MALISGSVTLSKCRVLIYSLKEFDTLYLLGVNDLDEVIRVVRRNSYSSTSFYELGLFLGLSIITLKQIEANHRGDVQ